MSDDTDRDAVNARDMPLRATMCATCPFKPGSPYAYLQAGLIATMHGRICHMTGSDNGIHEQTGKPEHLCRGARDVYNKLMHSAGAITAPTDAAWNEGRIKLGMAPQEVRDPT